MNWDDIKFEIYPPLYLTLVIATILAIFYCGFGMFTFILGVLTAFFGGRIYQCGK
jgi:hypothetical protein